jgi:hypothetical protein
VKKTNLWSRCGSEQERWEYEQKNKRSWSTHRNKFTQRILVIRDFKVREAAADRRLSDEKINTKAKAPGNATQPRVTFGKKPQKLSSEIKNCGVAKTQE